MANHETRHRRRADDPAAPAGTADRGGGSPLLGATIRRIARTYPADRRAPFAGHPAVALLRREAPAALRD
ncbi:MAG TPA: hypothetical protein VFG47_15665, partial [Geminicoccaceae bacterium]|nr:hypothetical protein [Geminicoccaceae bacterium]